MHVRSWVLACTLMLAATAAAAQQTIDEATVAGRVTDATGGAIDQAVVTTRHLETNVVRETTTDASGRFRVSSLRIGRYDLVVARAGFATWTRPLVLTAGSAFDVPVMLDVESVIDDVTVHAEAPVLDTARSQAAVTVAEREVRQLPLDGRNFLDIALLAPSVVPPNINSTQVFAETSAVPGVGLSVGGQRNFSNSIVVDGLSADDGAAGLGGMPYGVDAIEQVQVVTSGGQAALGRALGGHVNVVTRSGTNVMQGSAYWYGRDDRLNAANALSGAVLPMSQHQYGGSLGGPIARNRTFFFGNVERRRLDQTGLTTIDPATVAIVNQRLDEVGYPGARVATGVYDMPVRMLHLLGKVDHVVSARQQVAFRYAHYDVAAANVRGAGGLSAPSASTGLDNRDQAAGFSHTATLGTRAVSETRVQYTLGDLRALPSDTVGPAVSIAGTATFGTLSTSPQGRVNRMVQVVSSVAHQRGAHALRAGIDVLHDDDRIVFPRARGGSYAFASLDAFLAGRYNNAGFTQTFGATDVHQRSANVGVYVQDAWTAARGLTIDAGLRYDVQQLETIRTDADNLSPRLGVAWSPTRSGSTVIRGSAGLHVDRVPLRALANALLSAGNTTDPGRLRQTSISLSPGQAAAPVFPQVLAAPQPSVTLVSLTTMERDLQNARSRQVNLEIERLIGSHGTLSAGYAYVAGDGLLMAINRNVPSCVPSGTNNGCRPNPAYANDSRYSSAGTSRYHALTMTFVQRPAPWAYYRASYTLSKASNDVGEFFFSGPIDPFDLSKDWGRADNDRRHLFVFSGGAQSPDGAARTAWQRLTNGFALSGTLQAYSAAPFTVTSGVTTLQGTAGRPIVDGAYIARNTGIGDAFFSLNLRLSRTFPLARAMRLEAALEVFNATNAINETARNTNFGTGAYPSMPSPSFDRVTAVGEPRSAQLALRLRF